MTFPKELRFASATAPARVNLLGEHTDYTGGLVLPMAISFETKASIQARSDDQYGFSSDLFDEVAVYPRAETREKVGLWTDYPIGVLRELQRLGIELPGFNLHLAGNIPLGSGLSSSASVEIASALAMLAFTHRDLPIEELAVLCRRAENNFVSSPCGIMDQFAIAAAIDGHALLLDTRTLEYEHLPMNRGRLAEAQIIICNSMVRHSVATGEYGKRREESEEGQRIIMEMFPWVRGLGDATLEQLELAKGRMSDACYRRCKHIVSDNARVRSAKEAMLAGDPVALGKFMLSGHTSEREDFECSCPEIDFLVETAAALPGCFGARLTGGGFGGCTVNLVERNMSSAFAESLKTAYKARFGSGAEIYACEAVDGACARIARARVLAVDVMNSWVKQ